MKRRDFLSLLGVGVEVDAQATGERDTTSCVEICVDNTIAGLFSGGSRYRQTTQAQTLVALWNARAARKARPSFYPALETAMLAGTPWLSFMCPACQSGRSIFAPSTVTRSCRFRD
jgi:hypothetical protein